MFNSVLGTLKMPALYKESEAAFWDDDYISMQMLKAHLDPELNGASRTLAFIEKSVSWIKKTVPPHACPSLLDIGCGPGLYAERFAQCGYEVVGVDFSKRSISYAKNSAMKAKLNIQYMYQNYLTLDLDKRFDLATMIYCDYGALSANNRKTVMQNIYQHLKPGGKLLLDVFSMKKYSEFREQQSWKTYLHNGFWRGTEHCVLNRNYKYSDCITLEQFAVITREDITAYYLWNNYFRSQTFIKEANEAGFTLCEIYGDVAGGPYNEESETIAALLQK